MHLQGGLASLVSQTGRAFQDCSCLPTCLHPEGNWEEPPDFWTETTERLLCPEAADGRPGGLPGRRRSRRITVVSVEPVTEAVAADMYDRGQEGVGSN